MILFLRRISPSGPAHKVLVEEFGPQPWTLTNGKTGEACAIVGMQSCIWNTFNQNFLSSLLSFVSGLGVTDASLYGANILGACAPTYPDNPNDDNSVLDTATSAMERYQYSVASDRLNAIVAQWNKTGIRGAKLTGLSLVP